MPRGGETDQLDGLDDVYRLEIDRALSGRDMTWTGETTPITAHVWGARESGHQRLFVAAAELIRLAATGHGLLLVVDDAVSYTHLTLPTN